MQPHRRQLVRFSKAARSLCRDPRCPDTFKQQLQEARAEWRRRQPLEVLHLLALPSSRAVRGALKDGLYHAAAFTCTAAGFSVSGQLTMLLPLYRRCARMALPSPMRAAAIKIKVVTKSRIVGIIHASPGVATDRAAFRPTFRRLGLAVCAEPVEQPSVPVPNAEWLPIASPQLSLQSRFDGCADTGNRESHRIR